MTIFKLTLYDRIVFGLKLFSFLFHFIKLEFHLHLWNCVCLSSRRKRNNVDWSELQGRSCITYAAFLPRPQREGGGGVMFLTEDLNYYQNLAYMHPIKIYGDLEIMCFNNCASRGFVTSAFCWQEAEGGGGGRGCGTSGWQHWKHLFMLKLSLNLKLNQSECGFAERLHS